jgi:type I restriction enzyme S subunit
LPAHWDVVSSKRLFSARKELAREKDQQLAATQAFGVISQKEFERRVGRRVVQITQNLEKRRHVEKDDFVISMRSFQGGLERAWEAGCIRSSYVVLKPSPRVDVGFFQYLLKSHDYIQALQATSNFIRDGQDLNMSNFALVDLPLPPNDEQRLLARFLDWHGAQTAKLIRAKKKIIALLNEQKQAIIHRAVTRGLDPNVRLKPSGIPWLGDVPEGWEVKPLKHWAGINRRTLSQNTDPDYAFDYVDISAVATGYLSATPERMRFEASPSRARRIVQQGDTLISTVRTYLKAIYHVDRPWPDLIASTGFAVLTPRPSIDARFFGFVLQSKTLVDQVVANSIGVAYPAISETRLGSLHVCLPPSRQEQEGIINHLQTATVDFDRSIEATQREITLIQEFRTRQIADVVTGKLDVRAAAASLPETVELEPIDDLVEGDDLDEAVDDAENEVVAA